MKIKKDKSQLELSANEQLALRQDVNRAAIKVVRILAGFDDGVQNEILGIVGDSMRAERESRPPEGAIDNPTAND